MKNPPPSIPNSICDRRRDDSPGRFYLVNVASTRLDTTK